MTHLQTDMELKAGKSGTLIRFMWIRNGGIAPKVELAGSIVRVCLPTFSDYEYHPFSAFYDSYDARYACVYIHKAGDWTRLLHTYAKRHRFIPRAWIAGPMYSEFQACMTHKNITCICSGTAITPVMGVVQYWEPMNHTVTLVWVLRDKSLIPMLLPAVNPRTKVIILYTGKDNYHDVMGEKEQPIDEFFEKPEVRNPVQVLRESGRNSGDVGGIANIAKQTSQDDGSDDDGDIENGEEDRHSSMENPGLNCTIIPGSLRKWKAEDYEKFLLEQLVTPDQDPLPDNVVALSFKSPILAQGFEKACVKHKVPKVRCDASFG